MGRKNRIQIGSESAGPKISALLSVLKTCKRPELNAREYLREVPPVPDCRETRARLTRVGSAAELTSMELLHLRTAAVQ